MRFIDEADETRLSALARRALDKIPGVIVGGVEARRIPVDPANLGGVQARRSHMRELPGAVIRIVGWTQSWHEGPLSIPIADISDPSHRIEAFANRQRARAAAARRHDRRCTAPYGRHVIGHLRCDRTTLDMLLEHEGRQRAIQRIRGAIGDKVAGRLNTGTDLKGRLLGFDVDVDGMRLVGGSWLVIRRYVPDTVLTSIVGRPLGDLVETRAALARRRVVLADRPHDRDTWLKLERDTIEVRDRIDIERD